MRNKLLCAVALPALMFGSVFVSPGRAAAQEMGSLAYYGLTDAEWKGHEQEWRVFMQYEKSKRELCQHYQKPPAGFVMRGCHLYRVGNETQVSSLTETYDITPTAGDPPAPPIPLTFTVLFDFDKWDIRADEQSKINEAVMQINSTGASHVTISGHADRSGSEDYNMNLSEDRADSVAAALGAQGVKASVLEKHAYGETSPAVPTADGVKNQQNRRVVIDIER